MGGLAALSEYVKKSWEQMVKFPENEYQNAFNTQTPSPLSMFCALAMHSSSNKSNKKIFEHLAKRVTNPPPNVKFMLAHWVSASPNSVNKISVIRSMMMNYERNKTEILVYWQWSFISHNI